VSARARTFGICSQRARGQNCTPCNGSLYCYSMILYADADYLAKVQALKRRSDLTLEAKRQAIEKLQPDLNKRSAIRCINDVNYRFARYFSLRQHQTPSSMPEIVAYNGAPQRHGVPAP